MKTKLIAVVGLVVLLLSPSAYAAVDMPYLECVSQNPEVSTTETPICDTAINNQVSINDGDFIDAPNSNPATAKIGDKVTWKLTITSRLVGFSGLNGQMNVRDELPNNFSYFNGAVASSGTYDNSTSNWYLDLSKVESFPITLTIPTVATGPGLAQNTAAFYNYVPNYESQCVQITCSFIDGDTTNNISRAFVDVKQPASNAAVLGASTTKTQPQVLGASLVDTGGSNLLAGMVALGLIGLALMIYRRNTTIQK